MTNQKYDDKIKCQLCGEYYLHLGSHIWHRHKIKANQYKEMFELDHKHALISKSVYDKKHEHYEQHREKYLTNFLKEGEKYRFNTKGQRQTVKHYISAQSKRRATEQILKLNKEIKPEQCPVCKIIFDNVDSHLYNKHRLLKVKLD